MAPPHPPIDRHDSNVQEESTTLVEVVLKQNTLPFPDWRLIFVAVRDWIVAFEEETRVRRGEL